MSTYYNGESTSPLTERMLQSLTTHTIWQVVRKKTKQLSKRFLATLRRRTMHKITISFQDNIWAIKGNGFTAYVDRQNFFKVLRYILSEDDVLVIISK